MLLLNGANQKERTMFLSNLVISQPLSCVPESFKHETNTSLPSWCGYTNIRSIPVQNSKKELRQVGHILSLPTLPLPSLLCTAQTRQAHFTALQDHHTHSRDPRQCGANHPPPSKTCRRCVDSLNHRSNTRRTLLLPILVD
jgi:ribosomal protein L40E